MEAKEASEYVAVGLIGGSLLGFIPYVIGLIQGGQPNIKVEYPYDARPTQCMQVDVNHDGLEDNILNDGNVMIKQADGSMVNLREYKIKDIEAFKEKYTFRPEQARNTFDNLDYKVNTGRYVLGN